jgi:hypothetical protein
LTDVKDYHAIEIVFDSQNGFGAFIRGKAICRFRTANGAEGDFDESRSVVIDGGGPLGEFTH